jgi:hypothetical protein
VGAVCGVSLWELFLWELFLWELFLWELFLWELFLWERRPRRDAHSAQRWSRDDRGEAAAPTGRRSHRLLLPQGGTPMAGRSAGLFACARHH